MYSLDRASVNNSAVVVLDLVLFTMNEIVTGESSQYSGGINFAWERNLLHCRRFMACSKVAVCEMYPKVLVTLIDDSAFIKLILRYMTIEKRLDFVDAFDIVLERFGAKSSQCYALTQKSYAVCVFSSIYIG